MTWITWSYHRVSSSKASDSDRGYRPWAIVWSNKYFSLLVVSDTFAVSILNYVGRISSLESLQNSGMVNSPFLPSHRKAKYQLSKSERHFLQVKSPIVKSQFVEEGTSEIQLFAG